MRDPRMFLGLPPGVVHQGMGQGSRRLMLVMRQHASYEKGDMQYRDFPAEPDQSPFVTHNLNSLRWDRPHWPYTVGLTRLKRESKGKTENITYYVVCPHEQHSTVNLGGRDRPLEPGSLLAMQPGCEWILTGSPVSCFAFEFRPNWEQLHAAMAYCG